MKFKNLKLLVSMSCLILILAACNEDDAAPRNMGSVQFEITDAPIDDASVKSVFVTVADIKVDGQSISGFNKTTIDVLAFQNGNTSFLADTELEAKTYTDLTLVLDFENDENVESTVDAADVIMMKLMTSKIIVPKALPT